MNLSNTTQTARRVTAAILDNPSISDHSYWLQVHEQLAQPNEEMHNIVSNALQSAYNTGLNDDDHDERQQHVAKHIADSMGQKLAETLLPYVHEAINDLDQNDDCDSAEQ